MLYDRWQEVARQHPGELALVDAATGRRWTFRELDQAAAGASLPDRAVIVPPGTGPDFILAVLAAWRTGRVVLPSEDAAPPDLPRRLLSHPSSTLSSVRNGGENSPDLVHALRPITEALPLPPRGHPLPLGGGEGRGEAAPWFTESDESVMMSNCAPAHLKLTSGTTGASQLIAFTAEQLAADAAQIVTTMGLRPDQPNLGVISLAHSYGFSNLVTPLLLHGIPLVLCPSPMPEAVKSAAAGFESLALPAVPALWRAWHDGGAIPENVQLAISAGAPLPLELEMAVFAQRGLKIHNFYGSSECGGIAYDDSAQPRTDTAFAGRPLRGVSLSLGDDGCLIVHSDAAGLGYIGADGGRLGRGRFVTSDLAELRGDQVFLRGRATDVINVAGRKLSPEVVEAVVKAQPGVRECVVVGLPARDAARGEEVLAVVALTNDANLDALRQSTGAALPGWQCPRHWWVVSEISATARGKISRREWRERYFASLRS